MVTWLARFLARYLLPALVEFFFAFLANLKAARADDADALATVELIVKGIQADHPEWSGDQKRAYAFDAIKKYFADAGREVGSSIVNTLVELAVQRLKAASGGG